MFVSIRVAVLVLYSDCDDFDVSCQNVQFNEKLSEDGQYVFLLVPLPRFLQETDFLVEELKK
jgi:hypothetical protein